MSLLGSKRSRPEETTTPPSTRERIRTTIEQIRTLAKDLEVVAETIPDGDALSLREFCDSVIDAASALEAETKLLEGAPVTEPEPAEPA